MKSPPAKPIERLTIEKLCDEGCINLLKKFLKLLSRDYTEAYAMSLKNPKNREAVDHYNYLKTIFVSQYFTDITNLNGSMIVDELERRYRSACSTR